ncbi:hypothetical protein [Nostocoides sp. HKS02]|uniref:cyanophycin synthetase family protein n=1 Tax=Nostocoides sp. HKS02 TaxID=1813880 RepID=UPI001E576DCF|nr:hypothetical protein [Tetrasphaera sp. HKS02]
MWCIPFPQALRSTSPRCGSWTSSKSTLTSRWPWPRRKPEPATGSHGPTARSSHGRSRHPHWTPGTRAHHRRVAGLPRGNIWSYNPAIHLVLDLGVLEGYPTDTLEGFTDRLVELLPGLENHTCSRGVRGGFIERLREGTWLGHVAEHVALQLQQEAGHDLRRGKTRAVKGTPGRYNVIYDYNDETVGLAAGTLAVRLVNHLVQAEPDFDFADELEGVPAPSPARLLRALDRRDP